MIMVPFLGYSKATVMLFVAGIVAIILDQSVTTLIVTLITVSGGAYATRANSRSKRNEAKATDVDKSIALIVADNATLRAQLASTNAEVKTLQKTVQMYAVRDMDNRTGLRILSKQLEEADIEPMWTPVEMDG